MIRYVESGLPEVIYDIATLRNGRSISIDITLHKRSHHGELVKSVLASFRWLD